ncbi:hypothetical protein [Cohnella cellulosilytica]|uniref:Uncharacterized protein n=1 Tax=Cohnella cellulosilytica TaxID=986710 RepID=A0ABW2FA42_9BACL
MNVRVDIRRQEPKISVGAIFRIFSGSWRFLLFHGWAGGHAAHFLNRAQYLTFALAAKVFSRKRPGSPAEFSNRSKSVSPEKKCCLQEK